LIQGIRLVPLRPTHQVDGEVSYNTVQPREERSGPLEPWEASVHAQERFLHHLASIVLVLDQAKRDGVGAALVSAHQGFERSHVSRSSAIDESGVRVTVRVTAGTTSKRSQTRPAWRDIDRDERRRFNLGESGSGRARRRHPDQSYERAGEDLPAKK